MTARKPVERRQRGQRTKDVGMVTSLPVKAAGDLVSAARVDWAPAVAEAWAELWNSPLAALMKPTDMPALRRLFDYRHQLIDAQRHYGEEPVAVGSMGQPVLSPFAAEIHRLESVIAKLEDRFGLTPLARLRLGVTFEEGVSLAQRNAQFLAAFKETQS
jgi:hypothetical protein